MPLERNWEIIPEIYRPVFRIFTGKSLSLAYYLVLEDRNPLSRFPKWALTHTHPYSKAIPSQRSSEMLRVIGRQSKLNFLQLQGQRRVEKEFLAYDITSISSYSTSLKQVKYGYTSGFLWLRHLVLLNRLTCSAFRCPLPVLLT